MEEPANVFESPYAVRRKNFGDCRAFDSKGLEDKRCHGVRYPIVTVSRVYRSDSGRSARLAGDIIKQCFCQTTIIGSAILLAENFLRDEFISLRIVQNFLWDEFIPPRIVHHPNAVYLFVHRVEVCLH